MKLLIVEDNAELSDDLAIFLTENGFVVEVAYNLNEAEQKIFDYSYDLVILDLGLPDGSGLDLLRKANASRLKMGFLIVTARNAIEDKVAGLELGADDYITKPFHKAELNARVRSIIRRKNADGNNLIEIGNIAVNLLSLDVTVAGMPIDLTRKEFDLLVYFLYNKNRVLTKESIVEHLWGDHADQADSFDFIYNHIKNLRKKLQQAGGDVQIQSVYGMGYKFSQNS
ncbi:MAG: response regulator transcription factor [Bacteroidales bacterium]|jgi:DNA-binding response OmpR family regulator|nr:response regulator transcription factor [Bacteroidales bacterium]